MKRNPIETVFGAVVIFVALYFLIFASSLVRVRTDDGQKLTAKFSKVGDLVIGSDVKISGIKVGSVSDLTLDKNFLASVTMVIKPNIKIPADSVAMITSDGLMGNKYIRIEPGKSREILKPNDSFTKVKSFRSLEDTVGELIFLVTGSSSTPEAEDEGI